MLNTLAEVIEAHEATGGYWFTPATCAFFKSAFAPEVLPTDTGAYFLSRETNPSGVTMWTVRYATDGGEISTVGDFFAYDSQQEATTAALAARDAGQTE